MSHPRLNRKQRRKCHSNRLASQFVKRLAKGLLIDRTQSQPKMAVKVPAPKALALGRES